MGIFGKKMFLTRKQMRPSKLKYSKAVKKILANKNIEKALEQKSERVEFFKALQSQSQKEGGGVSEQGFKKVLGDFYEGKGRKIDRREAQVIANELIKSGRKFDFREESSTPPDKTISSSNNRPVSPNLDSSNSSRFSSPNSDSAPRPKINRSLPRF